MSMFSETIQKAINDYRLLLRRYLNQQQRVEKLSQLNLRNPELYTSDIALYQTAYAIISDMQNSMDKTNDGYYSYSGIQTFCKYLQEFLNQYIVEDKQITHRAQKASGALIKAIQLASSTEELDGANIEQFMGCNATIVAFGSQKQWNLYTETLDKHKETNGIYQIILDNFKKQLNAYLRQKEEKQATIEKTEELSASEPAGA